MLASVSRLSGYGLPLAANDVTCQITNGLTSTPDIVPETIEVSENVFTRKHSSIVPDVLFNFPIVRFQLLQKPPQGDQLA
jgi:hypothetical protein